MKVGCGVCLEGMLLGYDKRLRWEGKIGVKSGRILQDMPDIILRHSINTYN